jgi:4-hydroxythreonine-4-phosphate dehydrogenase
MGGADPLVAVTMGDPAGIGPEIIAKTFADPEFRVPAIVVGDAGVLSRTVAALGLPLAIHPIADPGERPEHGVGVLAATELAADLAPGVVDARAGAAAYRYVERAVSLALAGEVSAVTTAPLHKEALRAAGVNHPGHTEILAELTKTDDYAMMLCNDELRVLLVTIHLPLKEAIAGLDVATEIRAVRLAHQGARQLGIEHPRVAVAGLNPHAGEGGLFGDEDLAIIAPAVARARAEGIDASGPWPGDTVFMQARQGHFDIVVAQYHDQGLIPVKYLGIERGVNVTVGLPFVRTSVDHGTAFDIAGTGVAEHTSLRIAIELAATMCAATAGRAGAGGARAATP